MLIADVGLGAWDEIDYEPAARSGVNYGGRNREGAHSSVSRQFDAVQVIRVTMR